MAGFEFSIEELLDSWAEYLKIPVDDICDNVSDFIIQGESTIRSALGEVVSGIPGLNGYQYGVEAFAIIIAAMLFVIGIFVIRVSSRSKTRRQDYTPDASPAESDDVPEYTDETPAEEPTETAETVAPAPAEQPKDVPSDVLCIGGYYLYEDHLQVSNKKTVRYPDVDNVRYVKDYEERIVLTVKSWEITLRAQDRTMELYQELMSRCKGKRSSKSSRKSSGSNKNSTKIHV